MILDHLGGAMAQKIPRWGDGAENIRYCVKKFPKIVSYRGKKLLDPLDRLGVKYILPVWFRKYDDVCRF
jgi:hypothetical protein